MNQRVFKEFSRKIEHNQYLLCDVLLLETDGLFEGDLVEGIHRVLHVVGDHSSLVRLDTNLK